MSSPLEPAQTLQQVYRNADPSRPLTADHPWYVDLSGAREQIRPGLLRRFAMKQPGDFEDGLGWERILFLSQRGTGKTTELNNIASELRDRYEVVMITANAELHTTEFDFTELLLIIALSVERHMREFRNLPLARETLDAVRRWFAEVTRQEELVKRWEVELGGKAEGAGERGWLAFSGGLSGLLRYAGEVRNQIVEQLKQSPGDLVNRVNDVLRAAHERIQEGGEHTRELLLIVDNLDRYPSRTLDAALVQGADHLRALYANLILTPSLALVARPESEPITALYASEYMHTPAVRGIDDPPELVRDPGRRLLFQMLDKRIDRASVMEDPDALTEELIRLSGGSLRDLLRLVQASCLHAQGDRLNMDALRRAKAKELSLLRLTVNTSGFLPRLVEVARRKQLASEPDYLELLHRRWVLAYNGEDWFDLAPLVRAVPEVAHELRAVEGAA